MSKLELPITRTGRECGDCKACCTAKSVLVLNKGPGVPCPHLCDTGCSIHPDRPTECLKYKCLWLQGFLEEDDRPDKSGFILDIDREGSTQKHFFATQPAWSGAFEDEKVVYRHRRLAKRLKQPVIANGLAVFAPKVWRHTLEKTFGKFEANYV